MGRRLFSCVCPLFGQPEPVLALLSVDTTLCRHLCQTAVPQKLPPDPARQPVSHRKQAAYSLYSQGAAIRPTDGPPAAQIAALSEQNPRTEPSPAAELCSEEVTLRRAD